MENEEKAEVPTVQIPASTWLEVMNCISEADTAKLELQRIRYLCAMVLGADTDGKDAFECVRMLVDAYQAEYRKTHVRSVFDLNKF